MVFISPNRISHMNLTDLIYDQELLLSKLFFFKPKQNMNVIYWRRNKPTLLMKYNNPKIIGISYLLYLKNTQRS